MALIITSKTRAIGNRAPVGPVSLNKDSPQAKGLVAWWPLHHSNRFRDLVGRNHLTPNPSANGGFLAGVELGHSWQQTTASSNRILGPSNTNVQNMSKGTWTAKVRRWADDNDGYVVGNLNGDGGSAANYLTVDSAGAETGNPVLRASVIVGGTADTRTLNGWDDNSGGLWSVGYGGGNGTECIFANNKVASFTKAGSVGGTTNEKCVAIGVIHHAGTTDRGAYADFRIYDWVIPHSLFQASYAPQTRWDLYWQKRKTIFLGAAANAIALSLPTEASITQTTATVGSTTDFAGGILYAYVKAGTSPVPPTAAEMVSGFGAAFSANLVPVLGINTFPATGLLAGTDYHTYFYQTSGVDTSNILDSGVWATLSSGTTFNEAISLIGTSSLITLPLLVLLDSLTLPSAPTFTLTNKVKLLESLNLSNASNFSIFALIEVLETALMSSNSSLVLTNNISLVETLSMPSISSLTLTNNTIMLDSLTFSSSLLFFSSMIQEANEACNLIASGNLTSLETLIFSDVISFNLSSILNLSNNLVALDSISFSSTLLHSLQGHSETTQNIALNLTADLLSSNYKQVDESFSFSLSSLFSTLHTYEANVSISLINASVLNITTNAIQNISLNLIAAATDVYAPTGSINEAISLPASSLLSSTEKLLWTLDNEDPASWIEDGNVSDIWTEDASASNLFTED